MTTTSSATTETARTAPFVGPRSFRFGEPLFGRDREILKLLDLLIAERIVLLFSPSGAGKTSLIQAGLIPVLREEGFCDLPIIRVKQPALSDSGNATPGASNRFLRGTLASLECRRPDAAENPPEHLIDLTSPEPALRRWADVLRKEGAARAPRMVLIFDQFEEILTTDPADIAAKEKYFDRLGGMLKDPALWALFAMREEYVAVLEPYLNRIPRRLASRFRLDLLDAEGARQAFERPFASRGVTVSPGDVTKLVSDLCRVRVQRPDGTTEEVSGLHVEPVHLQIVGLRLWNRVAAGSELARLDESDLGGTEGSVDSALAGYYADNANEIGASTGVGERAVREWCERQLITDQGLLGQVLREPDRTRGMPEPVIQKLIDAFLVRAEVRHGLTWYELAHDRLVVPIRDDNREWRQKHLHPSLLRAADWDRGGRPDSLLLRDRELEEVEREAGTRDLLLTDVEREYLARSRRAWDVKRRSRRVTRLTIATVMGVLVFATFMVSGLWLVAVTERQRAEKLSRDARRQNSELLIDRGIALCQQGRTDDGLLWLMRGLANVSDLTPPDPTLDRLARLELAAWRADITRLRWFQKSEGPVRAMALSRDGRTALTGSLNGTARLWDVGSGQPKGPPLKHDDRVSAVAFSPDGHTALTGSWDWTAKLWDVDSGQSKGPPLKHDGTVAAVAFSPDGCTALTGSRDETARLWDLASGQLKGPKLKHDGPVTTVAFSPDGRTALTGSADKTARLWNAASGQPKEPSLKHGGVVAAVAFAPDGRTALTGSRDGAARLWDLASGQLKAPLRHDGPVTAVAFAPDGRTALTGGEDKTAQLWDVASGQRKGPPLKHDDKVFGVAFSPDGRTALTGSDDKTARLWDVATGRPKGPLLKHDSTVFAVAFSPDGRTALTGSWDRTARLWDVATPEPIGLPLEHRGPVMSVSYSPDGLMVLTGSSDGTAQLWTATSQRPIGARFSHKGPVKAASFSPEGRWIATASDDRTAQLWRTPTPIEGSVDRLALWVRVVTVKQMDESGAIRSLELDSWKKLRDDLDRRGGPPDQPSAGRNAVSSPP